MLAVHRLAGTWRDVVDRYIILSEFSRQQFLKGHLPHEHLRVKPNFVASPPAPTKVREGKFALYVGRLAEGKGIGVLVDAWRMLSDVPLIVAGAGPLHHRTDVKNVTWIGQQPEERIQSLMQDARFLVFSSDGHEASVPLAILEAFAAGLPVIASDLEVVQESVRGGRNGVLFRRGDVLDLAAKVRWAWDHPEEMIPMGLEARREYEAKYTPERNYTMLMDIYRAAMERARERKQKAS